MRFLQQPTINLYGGKNLFEKLLETLRRLDLVILQVKQISNIFHTHQVRTQSQVKLEKKI